jgi:hypothetical protein
MLSQSHKEEQSQGVWEQSPRGIIRFKKEVIIGGREEIT